jgi:hypothetical protein
VLDLRAFPLFGRFGFRQFFAKPLKNWRTVPKDYEHMLRIVNREQSALRLLCWDQHRREAQTNLLRQAAKFYSEFPLPYRFKP